MGYPGDYDREDVIIALEKIDTIAKNNNKPLGFHVIESNHKIALQKIAKGYKFIAFSIDFFFLGDLVRSEMNKLIEKLK